MGVGGKDAVVGWVLEKAKTKMQGDTNGRFIVVVMSTCTHHGSIIHYKL